MATYNCIRYYQWSDSLYNYIVYLVNQIFFISVCAVLARLYMQKERKIFVDSIVQKQLITLFHNLIKVFQDGIIIMEKDNVLYHNETCLKLLERNPQENIEGLEEDKRDDWTKHSSQFVAYNREVVNIFLISAMKKIILDSKECLKSGLMILGSQFNNLWEYVLER